MNPRITSPAQAITKAASKQTYYTIRFLADRDRVEDAYRAYGYFRWVDDVLDGDALPAFERIAFLQRQESLLEACLHGKLRQGTNTQEDMLLELVQGNPEKNSGLQLYLRNMMKVMDFDARRRGRLISHLELNEYTRHLAIAVTEAIHYFIGHDDFAPQGEGRYLAVSGAHIAHMLRDTFDDVQAGYFNIPSEALEAHPFGLQDVGSVPCRFWVKSRVEQARKYFEAGHAYFARVANPRCRLASFAYMARFEWLLDTIEAEGYILRPEYRERKSLGTGLKMSWLAFFSMIHWRDVETSSRPIASPRQGRV